MAAAPRGSRVMGNGRVWCVGTLSEVAEHHGSQWVGEGSQEGVGAGCNLGKKYTGPGPTRKRSGKIKEPVRGRGVGLAREL